MQCCLCSDNKNSNQTSVILLKLLKTTSKMRRTKKKLRIQKFPGPEHAPHGPPKRARLNAFRF